MEVMVNIGLCEVLHVFSTGERERIYSLHMQMTSGKLTNELNVHVLLPLYQCETDGLEPCYI